MAAARGNAFTVEELATRLDGAFDGRFQLLTSGARTAPFRPQTLRATLEWSYNLLTDAEQQLLQRLSVFSGGWTAAAAEAVTVCSLALLAQLVNKSLVIADQQAGQTRYRLLETVRQFATEQLKVDEQEQRHVQRQHSGYYLHLLRTQEAVAITRAVNSQMMLTLSLNHLGAVLVSVGDLAAARATLLEAIQRGWQNQYLFFLMEGSIFFAELLVQESRAIGLPDTPERKALALTLLSCVRTQPATWQIFKDKAAQLQTEIEGVLPAELYAAAIARGKGSTLEDMVNAVLG